MCGWVAGRCILAEVECLLCLPVDDVASSSLWSPSPTAAGARSATAGSDGKRQPTDQGMPHAPVSVSRGTHGDIEALVYDARTLVARSSLLYADCCCLGVPVLDV